MASPKIVSSDLAPDEVVHYDLAGVEFELGGSAKSSFETDNRAALANALVHPWLDVEYPKVELIAGVTRDTLANHPEQDALSGQGPNAGVPFDADEINKVEGAKAEGHVNLVAIDANLDQSEKVTVGDPKVAEVAVTLAADDEHEGAKSAKAFKSATDTPKKDND